MKDIKHVQEHGGAQGRFRAFTYDSKTGLLLRVSPWSHNRIPSNDTNGFNLLIRQLAGDTTYGLAINTMKIGTGTTAPTDADTDLETVTATSIIEKSYIDAFNIVTFKAFFTDANLPDGSYTELGIGTDDNAAELFKLFARGLFEQTYDKSTGENSTFEYQIKFTNV